MANKEKSPPAAEKNTGASTPRAKKSLFRRLLKYFFLTLLIVLLGASAATIWLTQSQSGHAWLLETLNSALAPKPGQPGMSFRLTGLKGSLPFDFQFGLTASDQHGVWLEAPENRFTLNWRELPGKIHISALQALRVDISRFPSTEDKTQEAQPDTKPLTLNDIRQLVSSVSSFLDNPPFWLPQIVVEGVKLEPVLLPENLVATKKTAAERLALGASLAVSIIEGKIDLNASVNLKNSADAPIHLPDFNMRTCGVDLALNASPVHKQPGLDIHMGVDARITDSRLEIGGIPSDFLGTEPKFSLALDALLNADNRTGGISLSLAGPNLDAGHLQLAGNASWHSAGGWVQDRLDGPLDMNLKLEVLPEPQAPDSPLDILRAPAIALVAIDGNLPEVNLRLSLDCAELAHSGHAVKNLSFIAQSAGVNLPLDAEALAALENEHHIDVKLSADVDGENARLISQCYFQKLQDAASDAGKPKNQEENTSSSAGVWRAGVRNLKLDALGLAASGDMDALLLPDHDPALNGALQLGISSWQAISRFVPGQKFSGKIDLQAKLSSAMAEVNGVRQPGPQNADLEIGIPQFSMKGADGSGVEIDRLRGGIQVTDIFHGLAVNAAIESAKITAAGMSFGARVEADGPVAGPLNARISTTGDVRTSMAAQWRPGHVYLKTLDASLDVPTSSGKGRLGVRSGAEAEVEYGDSGISVHNLDLSIIPSGRLRANGVMAPEKLDFNLSLENLRFKPWQALAPQIPEGSASLRATLKGTPLRPQGNFSLDVSNLKVPGVHLAPIGAKLNGAIENHGAASSLNAILRLDPGTVKTLGGTEAEIMASLPLVFGPDGIPKPEMNGNLKAKVRWDGALGPIWNLLPIPDRRLNGRLTINIDASGTLGAPRINGGVNIHQARYEDLLLGVLLTDINLKLDLDDKGAQREKAIPGALDSLPGRMTLALNASDGRGGTLQVAGSGALDGNNLDVHAKIDRLKPLRRRDVHIELSGQAAVTGQATAPVVDGEIIVNQGEILLDNISFGGSVTTLPISSPGEEKKEAEKKGTQVKTPVADKKQGSLNVRINMLPRFSVEGRGLSSTWQANLLITGTPENPQITGSINVVRGNFDFLGKNFALTRGIVTFAGGSFANPLLDIEMTNETPDLTAHILVTGPVSKIQLSMTSDPSLPRDEILSRVLFGRSISDLSRLEALQLAAAVAQLAGFGSGAGGILNFAKKTLGVDVLRVGTSSSDAAGEPGDQTAGGTTIEMGKYINDMIYMGVQQGMKADSTAFIIQLELTPRTSLEVRTEQDNTWAGIKWKYNY